MALHSFPMAFTFILPAIRDSRQGVQHSQFLVFQVNVLHDVRQSFSDIIKIQAWCAR